jgi:MFS superfamily sulfate permease-like transporter
VAEAAAHAGGSRSLPDEAGPSRVDPRAWDAPPPSGRHRYVPILSWLPQYDRSFLRFDVIAGATVWGLVKRLVGSSEPLPAGVVLDVGSNADLDITSAEALGQLVTALRSAGIDFALAEARRPVLDAAEREGVLAELGTGRVFRTIDEAVAALAPISSALGDAWQNGRP